MNELINIGFGMEATGWQTLLFVAKMSVLFFSIWISISVLSNLAIVSGRESRGVAWHLLPNNLWKPSLLWTIFWILCQIQI